MNALTWTCSCGATHFFERRTPAEHEAWLELNWDRVLGRFGGVLSPLNRHEARSVRSRRRVGGHVCTRCKTFEARQAQQRRLREAA